MKSPTALSKVGSADSLDAAWREIFARSSPKSRRTTGIDNVSMLDVKLAPYRYIRPASYDVLHGSYQFLPLRAHPVPKPNGKMRVICIPTISDRIVQRSLLKFLTKKYHERFLNDTSYGFVLDRTVQDAVRKACAMRQRLNWVYKTDITSFFDRIPRTELKLVVRRYIKDRSIHSLLFSAIDCEIAPARGEATRLIKQQGIIPGTGVRQGMPLSPFFSNILLRDFDASIERRNFHAIRYADDLIFFAASRQQCLEIDGFCREELKKLDLQVPPLLDDPESKTRVFPPDDPADFLGLGIAPFSDRYVARLMPKQIQKIRRELLILSNPRELVSRKIKLANFGQALNSRVDGYLNAYEHCTNRVELENELDSIKTVVAKTLLSEHLKIDIRRLDRDAIAFLDI